MAYEATGGFDRSTAPTPIPSLDVPFKELWTQMAEQYPNLQHGMYANLQREVPVKEGKSSYYSPVENAIYMQPGAPPSVFAEEVAHAYDNYGKQWWQPPRSWSPSIYEEAFSNPIVGQFPSFYARGGGLGEQFRSWRPEEITAQALNQWGPRVLDVGSPAMVRHFQNLFYPQSISPLPDRLPPNGSRIWDRDPYRRW